MDHRIIQVQTDLRRSLVQPPTHSRPALMSDQVTLGLIQSELEKLQGWKLHNLSAQAVALLDCPQAITLSLQQCDFLVSAYACCPRPSCNAPLWWARPCLPDNFIGTGRLPQSLLGPPRAIPAPGWTSPAPSVSAHSSSALALNHLSGLHWMHQVSCPGRPKTGCSILDTEGTKKRRMIICFEHWLCSC